ncbi:MAG: hypothetical protein M0C28_15245 [Candidatus Moduliflexus flocculans]|nr:hypothetical protein [Candidatus Moduliflexus flocculans]
MRGGLHLGEGHGRRRWPSATWSASSPTSSGCEGGSVFPACAPPTGTQGRRRRRGPGRPDRGRRAGPARARGDGLRGPPRGRRRPRLRHPRVPPAQEHRRRRGRTTSSGWASSSAMNFVVGRTRDRRRPASPRGLRRRLHRHRRRPAQLHGHPGREPGRRLFGQRVPDPRQPDAGLRLPRATTRPCRRGQRAAVIGGGNVAMDSRPHGQAPGRRGGASSSTGAPGPRCRPGSRRSTTPRRRASTFHFLTVPTRYLGDEQRPGPGHGMPAHGARRARRVGPAPARARAGHRVHDRGRPGRRAPSATSPNPLIPQTTPGSSIGKWGTIDVDWETMATSLPGVYAGGDIVTGRRHRHPGHGRRPDRRGGHGPPAEGRPEPRRPGSDRRDQTMNKRHSRLAHDSPRPSSSPPPAPAAPPAESGRSHPDATPRSAPCPRRRPGRRPSPWPAGRILYVGTDREGPAC